MFVISRIASRIKKLKWNHTARPDVVKRKNNAPAKGQDLGFTIQQE